MSIVRRGGAHILKLIESGADPAAIADVVQLYSKDDAGVSQLFARASDGTITQLTPGGGGGAGSIAMADSALDVNPNISTEGTVDWYAIIAATNPPQNASTGVVHSKIAGGWIFNSFHWVFAGSTCTVDAPTTNTRSTTASDSLAQTALAANNVCGRMLHQGADVDDWGYVFRVPAPAGIARTLRVRTSAVEMTIDFNALLTDGVTPMETLQLVAAPSQAVIITVDYTAASDCELVFQARVRNNSAPAAGTSLRFSCATLA